MKCPHCKGTGILSAPTYGSIILTRREELGLTQQQVSELIGISRAQVANIESGRSDIPLSRIFKFADALKCQPKDLLP